MTAPRTALGTAVVVALAALPALAQEPPSPPDIPYVRATARRLDSLVRDTVVRRVSGTANVQELMAWVGDSVRFDDSTVVQFAAWLRDLFAHLTPGACMNAAVDFGPHFPIRELDSALSERYADIIITARVFARLRGNPVRHDRATDRALLAALLDQSGSSAIPDSQRVRRAFERRSPTDDEYCWFARAAWARLAALPAAQAAPLVFRMHGWMTR